MATLAIRYDNPVSFPRQKTIAGKSTPDSTQRSWDRKQSSVNFPEKRYNEDPGKIRSGSDGGCPSSL